MGAFFANASVRHKLWLSSLASAVLVAGLGTALYSMAEILRSRRA